MKLRFIRRLQISTGLICSLAVMCTSIPAYATTTESLENQSSTLQQELEGINSEILSVGTEIADIEIKIDKTNNSITATEEQLAIIKNTESKQYEEMKDRIQYMYENGSSTLLELLFSAQDLADFVNKADFIDTVSSYDRQQLNQLKATIATIKDQQDKLNEKKEDLEDMEEDLQAKESELNQKATETSTSISTVNAQLNQIRAAQAKAAEEAAASEDDEKEANASTSKKTNTTTKKPSSNSSSKKPSSYTYATSGGALTPSKGVVYYNGHRETYYSQRVLPGTGLRIPGRHVASDGTIRDKDNYICVASSDLKKGTLVKTSLGMGKVYDSGCASGTIDLYTDW